MQIGRRFRRLASKSPRELIHAVRVSARYRAMVWRLRIPRIGNDRTAYILGLFGTGRWYIIEQISQNIGERAKYFKDEIRFHPRPTSMIYSGHVTRKYISRGFEQPVTMTRILEAVGLGFADLVFVYRHPLDSLLTNWVFWRTIVREGRMVAGVTQMYRHAEELSAELERNFEEFKAFAQGDPRFYAGMSGPRFLSFAEFVEETELHLQSPGLMLRLEDFMFDPLKEFSRIAEILSPGLDMSRVRVARPRTKPYGYLAVRERSSQFRKFIAALDVETRRRIERLGYPECF